MADKITYDHTFGGLAGPIPTSYLDDNYGNVSDALADMNTFANFLTDSGAANAYVVTLGVGLTAPLTNGLTIQVKIGNTNTGASTLNFNGTGAKAITQIFGDAVAAAMLPANGIVQLVYSTSTTSWLLQTLISRVGAWNPDIQSTGATFTGAYTGQYNTVGNMVQFQANLDNSNTATGTLSNPLLIGGLPLTASAFDFSVSISGMSTINYPASALQLTARVLASTKTIQLQWSTDNSTAIDMVADDFKFNDARMVLSGFYFI